MSNHKESVRFFDYSQFHGKAEPVGSTFIRVDQLIKYWPEADKYKYGENPDVLIFQKVFTTPDYQFPKNFEGIKILDICDPMWLEGANVVEMAQAMDAVTCPTQGLADYIKQFQPNTFIVPDRFDIEALPEPKTHTGDAKTIVWFGYSHNSELLKPAIPLIEELRLNLLIISNDDPIVNRWSLRDKQEYYTYKKYNEDTIYKDLQLADFAILPDGYRPEDAFKSNNKTVKAQLAGLPVAKTPEEVKDFMNESARRLWFDSNYGLIKQEYDVRNSVKEMKSIISKIRETR